VTLRVVLDTNTNVSALIFHKGRSSWLRRAWQFGDLVPLVCNSSISELLRVLSYPKFRLGEPEIRDLLGDYLPYAETVLDIQETGAAPRCRDEDDQIFIDLAFAAKADALVTGDSDLLSLAGTSAIPILSPAKLQQRLVTKNWDEKRQQDL
jgi:putative PIN family toxin of toxin-antitoxin system